MERTFSLEARAVVPTTQGFTIEMPSAGRMRINPTNRLMRHRVAHRRQPGRSDGANQKIRDSQDEVRHRKSAAEAQAIGDGTTKNGEKPHHAAEDAGQSSRLLSGKIQPLLQVQGERRKSSVVGKTLEDLADVGNPEGPLEASANLVTSVQKKSKRLLALYCSDLNS